MPAPRKKSRPVASGTRRGDRAAASQESLPPKIEAAFLYTPDEAARFLRSNLRTLERWRGRRVGPRFVKVGRRPRYRGEALLAYVAQQETATEAA